MEPPNVRDCIGQSFGVSAPEKNALRLSFSSCIRGHYKAWDDLLDEIDALAIEAGKAQRIVMAHGPELPDKWPRQEAAIILNEIVVHLEGGGGLGLKTRITKRSWHRLIESCRIEGRIPQTVDEFRALQALANLLESRGRFSGRWRRSVENLGGPTAESLGNRPEHAAQGYATEIRARLNWRIQAWEPLIEELGAVGFRWEDWLAEHPPVPGEHGN